PATRLPIPGRAVRRIAAGERIPCSHPTRPMQLWATPATHAPRHTFNYCAKTCPTMIWRPSAPTCNSNAHWVAVRSRPWWKSRPIDSPASVPPTVRLAPGHPTGSEPDPILFLGDPMKSRRDFLVRTPLALLGLLAAWKLKAQATNPKDVPGATPAFNTGAGTGPEVTQRTFAEAGKLMQVGMSEAQREQAASSWRTAMAGTMERRVGPRRITLEEGLAPATVWNPELPGHVVGPTHDRFQPAPIDAGPLPARDVDIAFASVAKLGQWIRTRKLTSEHLTKIYLARIKRFDPKLRCVITLLEDHAITQARQADREIAAGHYRGPLHGIPWGVKDLLDTAGIRTTYGAAPFRNRVPTEDSTVVKRLSAAGAVLVAKLSMGALALN